MAERVERLRAAYADAGYGAGHRVALLLENRPVFFEHCLALNALGVGIVPINPDYRHDEMAYQMAHSRADLAVCVNDRLADLERVAAEREKLLPVLNADFLLSGDSSGSLGLLPENSARAASPPTLSRRDLWLQT